MYHPERANVTKIFNRLTALRLLPFVDHRVLGPTLAGLVALDAARATHARPISDEAADAGSGGRRGSHAVKSE
eukprot:2675392-Pyramimonas_sp.AAC.1